MLGGEQRYIFGVDPCGGVVCKDKSGEIVSGVMGVVTGHSSDTESSLISGVPLVVSEVPSACFVETTGNLSSAGKYNISGTCIPSDAVVHISSGYKSKDNAYLRKNIIARTRPDNDGNFTFQGITGPDDVVTVWLSTNLEYLEVMSIDNITITPYTDPVIPPVVPPDDEEDDEVTPPDDGDDENVTTPVQPHIIYYAFQGSNTQWVTCSSCKGDTTLKTGDPCRQCNGTGNYTAEVTCSTCNGNGTVNNTDCEDCVAGKNNVQLNCDLCEDGVYKEFICPTCGGDGYLDDGSACTCTNGKVSSKTCDVCGGSGGSNVTYEDPGVRVEGTGPLDITDVKFSIVADGNNVDIDSLPSASLACSTSCTGSGNFSVGFKISNGTWYVMWAETTDENGTFSNVVITIVDGKTVCLSGDTLITMADGSLKKLNSLVVGDLVMSQDGTATAITTLKRGNYSVHHTLYTFDDGTVIDEIHKHRFYNADQGFWQHLESWNIGDHAINQRGECVALVSKEVVHEKAEQFGLWTEDGSYYANGLLSGSADCNKRIIPNITADKAVDMMMSIGNKDLLTLMGIEGELP